MSYKGGASKGRLEIQDKHRFKKTVSYKVPYDFSIANKDWVSNPKSQKGKNGNSPSEKHTYAKCSKMYRSECLVGTANCFGCEKRP